MKYFSTAQKSLAIAGITRQLSRCEAPVDQAAVSSQTCEEKLQVLKLALQNMEMSWLSLAEQNHILRAMCLWGMAGPSEMHHPQS